MFSPSPRCSLAGLNRLRQARPCRRKYRFGHIDLFERRTLLAQLTWFLAGIGYMGPWKHGGGSSSYLPEYSL